ncbi:glutathione S-transferase [Aspergillus flavus]|uniref:glutathione transferase n=2 Tax=Aspergillus subgen. Circumdati TaxID=2720871 RepID=A0A5N6HGG6_ASPFL|nr:glutathione S-transferase [Aspergillus oryzae 3.042]KAB8251723.1 glutathione S-transferase [Aspergillus flavus]KDE76294.1 glutathione S-transferase [Aspergillus oryzae 100-8]|eukprot:EIT75844.1 glutathione S-transferase [Aspergillus oryzae 3.042]
MVLKLYGFPLSTCTRRVRTVLAEKGVEAEFHSVDLAKGEQKSESYLNNLHPFGKVPVLQDTETGVQIFESRAINQYLSSKYAGQGTTLSPPESDLKAWALYQQALSIEQSYFDPIVSQIAFEKVFKVRKGLGETDEARVQVLFSQLTPVLEGYERVLSKHKYLAGDQVTLADLAHLPYGVFVEQFGFADLLPKYPHVQKWWEELKARESWKKVTA